MGIKKHKATSAGRRWVKTSDFSQVTKRTPEKSLLEPLKRSGGRNSYGRITVRHRGGGHKRKYRIIDFKRLSHGAEAQVIAIEYDPNRSARIALIEYADKKKSYILHPSGLKVGDKVISGPTVEAKTGNCLPLRNIPPGVAIHNIELVRSKGGKLVRSAGNAAQIMAKEGGFAHIKMPSGEIRLISLDCYATVGQVGNVEHIGVSLGKAGRSRHRGRRPSVRGVVMNPHDHPLGGGEGKSSGGRHPATPWGKPAKGLRTRRKKKYSNKQIVKRR